MAVQLLKGKVKDPTSQSCLGMLQSSAQRGADMVRQVLSFARGADGQRVELQLRHVVRDLEKMLRHTLPKSIEIRLSVPRDLWPVRGDATQLYQVLMNLCLNARDAMPAGGHLTVRAQNDVLDEHYSRTNIEAKPGPYVVLAVNDTGTGIPEAVLEKIFDPFFTTKPQGKGTGLGLCTALGIVKNHGGFITTASNVGQGTEFSVYLPAIAATKAGDSLDLSPSMPLGRGERILVVDDDVSIRGITQATLEAHGYHVLAAGDGTEALALYAQHQREIKAVLMDMMMPIMDGPTTIHALRKVSASVPIIAVSGLAQDGKTSGLAGVGVNARLLKPYTAEKLLTTLREVLDQVDAQSAPLGVGNNARRPAPGSISEMPSLAGAL
jgi:CheY-like chemotaxis protein